MPSAMSSPIEPVGMVLGTLDEIVDFSVIWLVVSYNRFGGKGVADAILHGVEAE